MARVQIFLSTVSSEFRSYRDALRRDLTRHNVSVSVQEDFIPTGTETLDKLDEYIRHCDAVIHLVGDMTGTVAKPASVAALRQRYPDLAEHLPPLAPFLAPDAAALSYTQWEAWLALYHGKQLIIAAPLEGAAREATYLLEEPQRRAQRAHLERLRSLARYPEIHFANADRLAVDVLRSKLQETLAQAGLVVRPMNLPFQSLGPLFKGRESMLDELKKRLGPIPRNNVTPVVPRVLNGLGGVGKTRLAIEYTWRHAADYSALLLVGAESGESLQRNLAALCASGVLNLREKTEWEEAKQYEAVLNWLKKTPGWLLILDNVDSKSAAAAAEDLLPKLAGGHVLLTSRLADWSASLSPMRLDVLTPEAAVDFLLARTDEKRRKQANDTVIARRLSEELGWLALALEQAGAYITQRRLSFDQYLAQWQSQREKMLAWFDERLMQYHKPVAIAWQTSFDQLTAPAQRLLQRLAWLAPDPIPESLLEVPVPGDDGQTDALEALVELESYSLVSRAADHPYFSVHCMVQEVTRWNRSEKQERAALAQSLRWINTAFNRDPENPGNWPALDPLLGHARAVVLHATEKGITNPTVLSILMNQVGLLLEAKGKYCDAEPLYQQALATAEKAHGPEHYLVALSLNGLAMLYKDRCAYPKAETLFKRALAILEKGLSPEDLNLAMILNNLARLYRAQGAYAEAEPLFLRALAIREKVLEPEHPHIGTSFHDLALFYQYQGDYTKAESFFQRSLRISEKALGAEHAYTATTLTGLAELYSYPRRLCESQTTLSARSSNLQEDDGARAPLYGTDSQQPCATLSCSRCLCESRVALPSGANCFC
ncbi:MAG: tetratricopeptide repeat protein [Nitrospira sp.]